MLLLPQNTCLVVERFPSNFGNPGNCGDNLGNLGFCNFHNFDKLDDLGLLDLDFGFDLIFPLPLLSEMIL